MRLRWTQLAANDLEEIYFYLARARPADLESTIRHLYEGARSLRTMPQRGRSGLEPGTLELLLDPLPYVISYRIRGDSVEVLGFRHTAQDTTVH